jgi:hypothetical protein
MACDEKRSAPEAERQEPVSRTLMCSRRVDPEAVPGEEQAPITIVAKARAIEPTQPGRAGPYTMQPELDGIGDDSKPLSQSESRSGVHAGNGDG